MTKRHKVFVSYHHENDQKYRKKFEDMCGDVIVSQSVDIGDIDPNLKTETIRQKIRDEYLRDSTVTVVLIGRQTWQRKHVDWEISSSIRQTKTSSRSALLGIILPTYKRPPNEPGKYYIYTVPPRLYDNVQCKFATIHPWTNDPKVIQQRIHDAYMRKDKINSDNSRPMYGKNRTGDYWR